MRCGGSPVCGVFGGYCADGAVVVGLWVSVLCLAFSYREAYRLGSRVYRGLPRLGVYPNQNLLETLPGGWGFLGPWIFPLSCGCGFSCGGGGASCRTGV